jgi:hypothetical protein
MHSPALEQMTPIGADVGSTTDGTNRTLSEWLLLRQHYPQSFAFVIRCLPAIARLHLPTVRDNRFSRAD